MKLPPTINQQQCSVFYQPQIALVNGGIIGAEVLLRWRDTNEKTVLSAPYFPQDEENDLFAISEWMLREACTQGKKWLTTGMPKLMLAVNFCSRQFIRRDLSSVVAGVLSETGFPAAQLVLEIAESSLEEHQDSAPAIITSLHRLGVLIAIDDFGSGYSSLAPTQRLPVNILKIDKEFMNGIPSNEDDMHIVASIVAMGHALGLKVFADGVETQEQVTFLKKINCDAYQGSVFSSPVLAGQFSELF